MVGRQLGNLIRVYAFPSSGPSERNPVVISRGKNKTKFCWAKERCVLLKKLDFLKLSRCFQHAASTESSKNAVSVLSGGRPRSFCNVVIANQSLDLPKKGASGPPPGVVSECVGQWTPHCARQFHTSAYEKVTKMRLFGFLVFNTEEETEVRNSSVFGEGQICVEFHSSPLSFVLISPF